MQKIGSKPNSLINETSPYLLQHAHNPVDWYPWTDEALERARREDKPILLSIGYSACHWCHVMAHESFEDQETAELMNRDFINIKVDREERPDLDKIYQLTQQLLTRRTGGWPLTMFLTPDDRVPFFGGTYFPPEPRYGMPGFKDVLKHIAEVYRQQQADIRTQNRSLMEALAGMHPPPQDTGAVQLDIAPVQEGVQGLAGHFDRHHGGFSDAPKFPQVSNLELLLAYSCLDRSESGKDSLHMAGFTLEQMARGGIYDHLGGGFCRYSVDNYWMIPHFEKMLYDNGPLLGACAQAWHLADKPLFRQLATETAGWILRDMQSDEGGFYSSLDADSEGEEGKFYVWTPEQAQKLLTEDEYAVLAPHYGLAGPANFEGKWHLYVATPLEQVAESLGLAYPEAAARLDSARGKLLQARRQRVWPGRDEKILVSWNALTIRGLALAGMYPGNESYLDAADRSLSFLHDRMWQDGRLFATSRDGRTHLNAYLDDYAFLLDAVLTLLAVHWNDRWFAFAGQLADGLIRNFYNPDGGGFYFTSHDHEELLQRRIDFMDDATPSGNGVAVRALLQLGYLTGNREFIRIAENTLKAGWSSMQRIPYAHSTLLTALIDACRPPKQVVIRGRADVIRDWQKQCYEITDIRSRVYAIPDDACGLPAVLAEKQAQGPATAWVCEGFSCLAPYTKPENMLADLKPAAVK